MFGWLKRGKKDVSEKPDTESEAEKPIKPKKPIRPPKPTISYDLPDEAAGEMVQPGRLLLKQEVVTKSGTERTYVQPVKLEIPNMVTIGGKLDTIIDELDKKPNKEWFQSDYIETLKNVLTLTDDVNISNPPREPEAKKMAETISMIHNEVSGALILETLKVKGPLNITDLSKETGVSRVTIWRDLKKLSRDGRIKLKRQGKFKVASLKD